MQVDEDLTDIVALIISDHRRFNHLLASPTAPTQIIQPAVSRTSTAIANLELNL